MERYPPILRARDVSETRASAFVEASCRKLAREEGIRCRFKEDGKTTFGCTMHEVSQQLAETAAAICLQRGGTEVAEADVELAIRCLRATPVDVAFAPRRGNVHDLLLRSYADGGPERSEGDSAR